MLSIFKHLWGTTPTVSVPTTLPPPQVPASNVAPNAPEQPTTKTSILNRFTWTQALEQFGTYTVGGLTLDIGKFYQRVAIGKSGLFLDNPMGRWFYKHLVTDATLSQLNEETLVSELQTEGNILAGAGNFLKCIAQVWANFRYRGMAQQSGIREIIKKVAEFNSKRNVSYLIEKSSLTLSGFLYNAGNHYPSIALNVIAQSAILASAWYSLKGNTQLIAFRNDPLNMAAARDAFKVAGLNMSKGIWSVMTLGVFSYVALVPDRWKSPEDLAKIGIDSIPDPQNATQLYDVIAQNSWELPYAASIAGVILMCTPSAVGFALDAKHFLIGGTEVTQETESGTTVTKTDRTYHAIGMATNLLNGIGGYFMAFLLLQPIASIYYGTGSIGSVGQMLYRRRLPVTQKTE